MSKRKPGLWRVGFDFNLRGSAEEFLASVTTGRGWQGKVRRLNPNPYGCFDHEVNPDFDPGLIVEVEAAP